MEKTNLRKSLARNWRATDRRLKLIFWPVMIAAEIIFLVVQAIYVATRGISVLRFIVNCVLFNTILLTLMLLFYFLVRRILLRVYEYENTILTIEDISTDAVFTQNTELMITSWSKGAERIFGYSEEEALGSSVVIILPEQVPESDIEMIDALLRDGIVTQRRTIRRRKNGVLFPAEVSVSLLRGPDGEPAGGLTVLRDITQQIEMEEELLRTNAELKGYAHVVSHDLKAPLTTIKMAAQTLHLLLKGAVNREIEPQIAELEDTIDRDIDKSASLINELLTLAEAGQKPEEIADVDVRRVVGEVLDEMAGYIHETGATIRVDDEMGHVAANPTQIYQLFANLISNAIRHNDSGEPLVEVMNRGHDGRAHRYLVRDNGSGIPRADLDRIFVPFFRGDRGDTGIGLSTVAKIVDVYDGEIKAFNDNGACFEFVIRDYPDA